MEILAYEPMADISETYLWQTSVIQCWGGTQRIQLRENPRLEISYTYAITSEQQLQDFYDFSAFWLAKEIQIPQWSFSYFHSDLMATGDDYINMTPNLLYRYVQVGDSVILWKNSSTFQVMQVMYCERGYIVFTTPTPTDFSYFFILPLLSGRFNKSIEFSKASGDRKRARLVFEVEEIKLPIPYLEGFILDKVLRSSDFTTSTVQDFELIKSPLGVYDKINITSRDSQNWETWKGEFALSGQQAIVDFKILLGLFAGRFNSLTLPDYYLYWQASNSTRPVHLTSDSVTINFSPRSLVKSTITFEGLLIMF